MSIDETPPCPTCSGERGRNGRPKSKTRPDIRLATSYVSKIGAECGEIAEIVDRAASKAYDNTTARELAQVAEKLMQMKLLFQ